MATLDFGELLRRLRHERNETLEQVSETTGLSVAMLSRVERGERLPSPDSVEALAKHFGLPVDYLMSETIANRMVNRYGHESSSLAAEHVWRKSAELGRLPSERLTGELIAPEPDAEDEIALRSASPARAAPDRSPTPGDSSPVGRRYGIFQRMNLLAALDAGGHPTPPSVASDGLFETDEQGGSASATAQPGLRAKELGLLKDPESAQLSGASAARRAAEESESAPSRPAAPRIDPATRQVLRAATDSSAAAAMLALREVRSLDPQGRGELLRYVEALAEQGAAALRALAETDPDKRVRAEAAAALDRLGRH